MEKSVEDGLLQALKKERSERETFLSIYCQDDAELRQAIDGALPGYERLEEDLDLPALGHSWAPSSLFGEKPLEPGTRIGAYEVEREIGRGGMGVVYLGRRADNRFEKQVAIKLIAGHGFSGGGIERRSGRELRLLAKLEHANIARLLEGGETEDGCPYLMMEYIDGLPLNQYCDSHSLGVRDRLRLFQKVCEAVQFAHRHLIVHRDLKPSNILVSSDGVPHLLDFGIAKLLKDDDADGGGQPVERRAGGSAYPTSFSSGSHMTPEYASPEQVNGQAVTTVSDVYSLGVILYELLAHRRPYIFAEGSPEEIVSLVCFETPPLPSLLSGNRWLRGDLDAIAMKALHKEPQLRYASVQGLSDDIDRHLRDLPVEAARATTLYRFKKFARRNKGGVISGSLVAAALCAGMVTTIWQANVAQHERTLERRERIDAQTQAAAATDQRRRAESLAEREARQRTLAERNAAEALRQKQKADSRFDDVRRIATSFLFEFDGAIANVAGATDARRLVVSKGLEYLDKLAQDSRGDESLYEEIAGGYERLAGIQGNVYSNNLGQYGRATDTYERALAMRKELAARHPLDNSLKRDLGNSYIQAADGWVTSGDTKAAIGRYEEGVRILGSLAAYGDRSKPVQSGIQRGTGRLCNILLAVGDHRGAIENCETTVRIGESLVAAAPDDNVQRAALAVAYALRANALRIDNRPKEAIPQLKFAAAEFEKLLSSQPTNNGYARNLAGAYTLLGNTEVALGQTDEAVTSFERSIDTGRRMIKVDPSDARARTTLAASLIRLAPVLEKAGRSDDAVAKGKEGLEIFRSFADRPEATPDDLNNYASMLKEVGIPALQNPPQALSYSKRAVAAAKTPSLVLLSTLADAYFDTGDIDNAIATARRALSENPVPKGAGESGVRADLEQSLQKFQGGRTENAKK